MPCETKEKMPCVGDSADMVSIKRFFAEKANAYRSHLDKLRWILAGAYPTVLGVAAKWNSIEYDKDF